MTCSPTSPTALRCGAFSFDLAQPLIMGILNVTPDSFSDGGRYGSIEEALQQAERLFADGAAIVDIGGESTRPGAALVPVQEELARVLPVVAALAKRGLAVSIDTRKPEVMTAAIEAGACLVNDVHALQAPKALEVVAESQVGVCLMHMQGTPQDMQKAPSYQYVIPEVTNFLEGRMQACQEAGITADRLIVDPGFGFGKTREHNFQLLQHLAVLQKLQRPILVGLSRKSMLGVVTERSLPLERDYASVAAAVLALERGARILRVHQVAATRDAVRVWQATQAAD